MKRFFKPNLYELSIFDIDLEKLKELGIKGFIFDVDNTIVPYDTPLPDEKIKNWFKKIEEMGFVSYIASNNSKGRVEHFASELNIGFMPKAKKPLTKNLKQISENMGILPAETAMVGDQLFTDMLGGNMAGMFTILIEQISPVEGKFIKFKRIFEKLILPKRRRKKGKIC
ncbi:MAG: YqeG family HAD IIIA-type phosphatase [Ruminococcaceae bacterium]|nr:YqeG family HAD IIIA-type phosphatase [Oscillospiraceae bacterium]